MNIPNHDLALEILRAKQGANHQRLEHSLAVASLAKAMAEVLRDQGHNINVALVEAAALLHDVAKGQANHALAGGDYLRGLGYPEVAAVAELHGQLGGITPGPADPVSEAEVVYLADKSFRGPKRVTVQERFRLWREAKLRGPKLLASLAQGENRANIVKIRIEKAMRRSLQDVHPAELIQD